MFRPFGTAALLLAITIGSAHARQFPESEGGALLDRDTGLRCLNQFCDYVRDPLDVHCLCKKIWPNNDRRLPVTLQCYRFSFGKKSACIRDGR